jgi:hypothetical protein
MMESNHDVYYGPNSTRRWFWPLLGNSIVTETTDLVEKGTQPTAVASQPKL